MAQAAKKRRSKGSCAAEGVLVSAVWLVNLCQIATAFRAMSFMSAVTAGMILLIAPVEAWRTLIGFRECSE